MKARIATTDTAQTACGSKELEFPLPVSPSGGNGGGRVPPTRSTSRASQYRWHVPCAPLPPQEGLRPLVYSPPDPDRQSRFRNFLLCVDKLDLKATDAGTSGVGGRWAALFAGLVPIIAIETPVLDGLSNVLGGDAG